MVVDALSRVHSTELMALTSSIMHDQLYNKIKETWLSNSHLLQVISTKENYSAIFPKYNWSNGEF